MIEKIAYPLVYLVIAAVAYFLGKLLGDSSQYNWLLRIVVFFALAIAADRLLKAHFLRKEKDKSQS